MVHAARGLLAQGHRGAGLWVLRDNRPARAFYEGLGGTPVGEKADTLGDLPVVEIAYAWPSLSAMTATASATMGVGSSQ